MAGFFDTDRTRGRWPWVSAAGAPVTTAALLARRDDMEALDVLMWAALPVLLWHQTEEWVWPGGFMPFFNREVLDCDDDEFPISRRAGFVINSVVGWLPALAAGARGARTPELGGAVWTTLIANAAVHVAVTARARRYTPGIATSVTLLIPLGAATLATVAREHGRAAVVRGAALGLAAGLPPFVALWVRAKRVRF
jgi:hypothetical protein